MKPLLFAQQFAPTGRVIPEAVDTDRLSARLRIAITYTVRHRRIGNFEQPRRFTEWVQWRKLNDRDMRKPPLVDKVRAKHHVAALLGPEWVTPTLFHGSALPDQPEWPRPFVVKSRHGCRQCEFARGDDGGWDRVLRNSRKWMRGPYGLWLDEWIYAQLPLGILVEPFIGTGGVLPVDYKIHVFDGQPVCVQVDQGREHAHRRAFYDMSWNRIWGSPVWTDCAAPATLGEMAEAAALLGRDYDFVRADFYEIAGRPRFGELTFYPASGLRPLGDVLDFWLGAHWTAARRGR